LHRKNNWPGGFEVLIRELAAGVGGGTLVLSDRGIPGEWVRGLAFSPDSTRLAIAHCDGTVKLWSVQQLLAAAR
jgi:WD40 repeat protein